MAPIFISPVVLHSVNMPYALGDRPAEHQHCKGEISLPDICTPVCDTVFKGIDEPKEAKKKVQEIFGGNCDSVCQCICDPICDGVV